MTIQEKIESEIAELRIGLGRDISVGVIKEEEYKKAMDEDTLPVPLATYPSSIRDTRQLHKEIMAKAKRGIFKEAGRVALDDYSETTYLIIY